MPASASSNAASPIRDAILRYFPPGIYSLIVVSDPDDLLASEDVLQELQDRGFTLVMEEDPVLLRARVEALRPWSLDQALMIVTREDIDAIPFDLWQQAERVVLSLNHFFPKLAYPIVRSVSPAQRARLAMTPAPERTLGETSTIDFILHHAFGVEVDRMRDIPSLVTWLNGYHRQSDPMPDRIVERLLGRLSPVFDSQELNLRILLTDPTTFERFMRAQWEAFVNTSTGVEETAAAYVLDFEHDVRLQDSIAGFVRTGAIEPVVTANPSMLPEWARFAVVAETGESRRVRSRLLIDWLKEQVGRSSDPSSWSEWKEIATNWAELTILRHAGTATKELERDVTRLATELGRQFLDWLRRRYTSSAVSRVPVPHHVHHIPYWLDERRQHAPGRRFALIIMDGMSLADWTLISPVWRHRHPSWSILTDHVMAQIPTITAVSRQALVSGRRPAQLASSITSNAHEPRLWKQFWSDRGIADSGIEYKRIALDPAGIPPFASHRASVSCWIVNDIDDIVHGATLGTSDVVASLNIWLDERSPSLERGIQRLLEDGFDVVIASDHGHVQALGIGSLSEGLAVESRGKRTRTYRDPLLAERAREALEGTLLWHGDGLLPDDLWALIPDARTAFTTRNDTVVTHGGVTIDEVLVPLVTITAG